MIDLDPMYVTATVAAGATVLYFSTVFFSSFRRETRRLAGYDRLGIEDRITREMLSHVDDQTNRGKKNLGDVQRYGNLVANVSLYIQSAGRKAAQSRSLHRDDVESRISRFHRDDGFRREWYERYVREIFPALQTSK